MFKIKSNPETCCIYKALIAISLFFMSSLANASEMPPAKVSALSTFPALQDQISQLVSTASNSTHSTHQLFISHYDNDALTAYVYWQQGQELWILPISTKPDESWAFIHANANMRRIHLVDHVVASADDVGSSTFLVDRAWAAAHLFNAVVHGEAITIALKE
ncbi:hypothetical protein [Thaumasiovibrio subtropicus]|uniref:hypothetical protein n=1 Tax=Thaumasiovibrio subtropicus TaxID=1891207 RepID=UPI000B34C722|nr:hypothetical protein [Thaumasiovibrio subtropicus]